MPPKTNEEKRNNELKALFYNEIPDLTADMTKLQQLNLAVDILLTTKDKQKEEAVAEAKERIITNLENNGYLYVRETLASDGTRGKLAPHQLKSY